MLSRARYSLEKRMITHDNDKEVNLGYTFGTSTEEQVDRFLPFNMDLYEGK